jgi:hypothetical protein
MMLIHGCWPGGFAVEIHHLIRGADPILRTLNDIDFVASSFDCLPKDLQKDFLFRHVQPLDPLGKIMMQAVDAKEAVRIGIFNDGGAASRRAQTVVLSGWETQMISVEDLLARMARLSLDIGHGEAVPAKHVRDFLRLLKLADADGVEMVWADHRWEDHPATFRKAHELLQDLVSTRQELLITPTYSTTFENCKRCRPTPYFQLADPKSVHSILGNYWKQPHDVLNGVQFDPLVESCLRVVINY